MSFPYAMNLRNIGYKNWYSDSESILFNTGQYGCDGLQIWLFGIYVKTKS